MNIAKLNIPVAPPPPPDDVVGGGGGGAGLSGTASISRHWENSEVLLSGSVAVAVAILIGRCNAPCISAVIEADGVVRPCFFHKPYGDFGDGDFDDVINSPSAVEFRRTLNVTQDPICERCVCTLKL